MSRPAPVVLIFGKDVGAVTAHVARVREAVLSPGGVSNGLEAFNHERHEGPYVRDIKDLLTACATAPVGQGPRLVELTAPEGLGKQGRKEDDEGGAAGGRPEQWQAALLDYIADPCPSTVLLVSSTDLKGNAKLVNAAKKSKGAEVHKHDLLTDDGAAARRLVADAEARGIVLHAAAARRVIELVGSGTAETLAALGHAAAYVGEGPVSVEAVEAVVERRRVDPIWDLTDALGRRDASAALVLLARQFGGEKGDAIYALIPALASHLRRVYAVKACRGRPAEVLGKVAFMADKIAAQARRFDDRQLRDAVAGLAQLDAQSKGAARGARLMYDAPLLVLQRWVLDVCGASPGTPPTHR